MFGNVTALVGLHVTGKYRTDACSKHAPGMRPGILTIIVDQDLFNETHDHKAPLGPTLTRCLCESKNNYFTEMCSGSEAGSYARLIDFCITQLQA